MLILHGSLGLGDAIYMWPLVKHYTSIRNDVVVVTRYPELFCTLDCQTVAPENVLDCRCSARTKELDTNVFEDTFITAGLSIRPPLEIKRFWDVRKYKTIKPVCIIRTPSFPVQGDATSRCMVPHFHVYQKIINAYRDRVYFVSIGWPLNIGFKLDVDLDLTGIKDLREYLGAIDGGDIVISQPGHCVPIAEALNKPLLAIFANAGLRSEEKRYKYTTPSKILTRQKSRWIADIDPIEQILDIFGKILGDAQGVSIGA